MRPLNPQLRIPAIFAVVMFAVAFVVNVAIGNGVVGGLLVGTVTAATGFLIEWWALRRREQSRTEG